MAAYLSGIVVAKTAILRVPARSLHKLSTSSLAVTADGASWAVLNASPDIRQQLADAPPLHPTDLRDLPLRSVLVTNGDIDHVAGLLTLREMQPFTLFATAGIHDVLAQNPMFDALNASVVTREVIALDTPFELVPGIMATLFAVPGKVPLYLEGESVQTDLIGEQTVGVRLGNVRQNRLLYFRDVHCLMMICARDWLALICCFLMARSGKTMKWCGPGSAKKRANAWAICRWTGQRAPSRGLTGWTLPKRSMST